MTIEDARAITGGVNTHADTHVAAALDPIGGLLGVREFPATAAGYADLAGWLSGFGTVVLAGAVRCLVSYRAIGGLAVFTHERQAYGKSLADTESTAISGGSRRPAAPDSHDTSNRSGRQRTAGLPPDRAQLSLPGSCRGSFPG